MSIESVKSYNHLILCCPLLLLPSIFPSIRVFPSDSSLHQVASILELWLQHQSFPWIFRVDFLQDSLVWSCCPRDSQESSPAPQFKSMNSLVLQLSNPYMTSGKTIALTRWTFLGEVRSLDFNMVPRFVIPFMSRLAAALSWQRACITLWRYEPCGAGPRKTDRSVESSDKTCSTGGGGGKPLQYSCCGNTMTVW